MKQRSKKNDEATVLEVSEKPCEDAVSPSIEEIDLTNSYWIAYANPLMPMVDLTIFFNELKQWFIKKRKRSQHE